jgi:hypothetical protein
MGGNRSAIDPPASVRFVGPRPVLGPVLSDAKVPICREVRIPLGAFRPAWLRENRMVTWVRGATDAGNAYGVYLGNCRTWQQ